MKASRLLAACALITGCAPDARVLERALSPGDAVLALVDAESASSARVEVLLADASGRVALSVDDERSLVVAVLRAEQVVGPDGGPAPLDALRADLAGDLGATFRCTAPALDLPQRLGPGDPCPRPAALPLTTHDRPLEASREEALRARLRLAWPGPCASPPRAPLVESTELVVCPLGSAARRTMPVRTTLGPDGTLVGVARGRVVELDPAGRAYEVPIAPATRRLDTALSLGARGTLVVAGAIGALSDVRTDWVWVPGRGAGDAFRLSGGPRNFTLHGLLLADDEPRVWMYGSVLDGLASRGALFRCGITGTALECRSVPLSDEPACPSLSRDAVGGLVRLADGAAVGLTDDGLLFVVRDGAPRCLPAVEARPIQMRDGRSVEVTGTERFVGAGQRVVACMIGRVQDRRVAVVATATVGPGAARIRWETLADAEGFDAYCSFNAFVDPRTPDRLVMTFGGAGGQRALSIAASSTTSEVRALDPERLFAGLDQSTYQIATTSTGIGLTTVAGELWSARVGEAALSPRLRLDPPGSIHTPAAIAAPEGFRVAAGQGHDVVVRVPPGEVCDGVVLEAAPGAFDGEGGGRDDARVTLGGRVLAFAAIDGRVELRADGGAPILVPGEARAVSAAEVVPGASAAFVRSDGTLWWTDGAAVEVLDDAPGRSWRTVSAAGGVGWAAGPSALGRILPRAGGGLRVEADALERIGRARFDALTRDGPPQLTAVRARADGGALVAFKESLSGTVQGGIDDLSLWWIEAQRGALVMTPYEALTERGSRPVFPQDVLAIAGPERAPLLVFGGTEQSVGLAAPGSPVAAAPFAGLVAAATHGSDVLLVGPDLRLVVVRVVVP